VDDHHSSWLLLHLVDNPQIAHPKPAMILCPQQLARPTGNRVFLETLNCSNDPANLAGIQTAEVLVC